MSTSAPELSQLDQRILGALLEKQVTVPATYPLTLNALRTACNQSNNREPVTDHDEQTLEQGARDLKQRELLRIVWSDSGRRTLKYHQTLSELLGLDDRPDLRALVTVLLLRGPQAPGALKTRAERLHAFGDRSEVEAALQEMADATPPLVKQLERRPGDRDHRWQHLLGPAPAEEGAPAETTPAGEDDREAVLAGGGQVRDEQVRASYDAVAAAYTTQLSGELGDLPFERWLLSRVADLAGPHPVIEVGCGPGHVTAHLAGLGVDARGLDLSPAMVEQARARFPGSRFEVGDLRRLLRPENDDGWGAVLAWYSLVHTAPSELPQVLDDLVRPLRPGGWLVLAVHAGAERLHVDDWFDQPVDLDFTTLTSAELVSAAAAAGLTDVEWYQRGPLTTRGETTQRLYLLGRRPA